MDDFDKKMKELSKNIDISESYDKKVDEILQSIEEKEEKQEKNNFSGKVLRIAVCLVCIICVVSISSYKAEANFFATFRQTIMDLFSRGNTNDVREAGVKSKKVYVEDKPDLMMELQETVIDSHTIYLMVKITAPTNISFTSDIGFDYFCFCAGENYNNDNILSGARDCILFEVSEEKDNIATYVVSMTFDQSLEEGSMVTAYFKDLEINPYSDSPEMLVEGMWSITFPFEQTVTENLMIEGNPEMGFSFINTTAFVESIELTPSGMVLLYDVSAFPYDELGISDTTIAIKFKMIDGSEQVIVSHDPEENFIQGGSIFYEQDGEKSFQQSTLEFSSIIDISKICGIYVEDLYIPVNRY